MFSIVIVAAVLLAAAALFLLPGAIKGMQTARRQADLLAFRPSSKGGKGRHVRRAGRHARAARILSAH